MDIAHKSQHVKADLHLPDGDAARDKPSGQQPHPALQPIRPANQLYRLFPCGSPQTALQRRLPMKPYGKPLPSAYVLCWTNLGDCKRMRCYTAHKTWPKKRAGPGAVSGGIPRSVTGRLRPFIRRTAHPARRKALCAGLDIPPPAPCRYAPAQTRCRLPQSETG